MKKIIMIIITIWIALITTFITFELFIWYHFSNIPTNIVAMRFAVCFAILSIILIWINIKINDRIETRKKRFWVYSAMSIFLISYSILGGYILLKNNENLFTKIPFTIVTSKLENESDPYLYTTLNNQKVYTNLEYIKIKKEKELIELKEYIKVNPNAIEEMMENMVLIETYRDGGTKLYQDKNDSNFFTNEGLTLIECHKSMDAKTNTDIYIGPDKMKYQDDFCENKRIIKRNNTLFYDTKIESKMNFRCGTGMEKIATTIKEDEIPSKENESNFGAEYEFMNGENKTLEVFIDGKWIIFEPRIQ